MNESQDCDSKMKMMGLYSTEFSSLGATINKSSSMVWAFDATIYRQHPDLWNDQIC